MNRPLQALAQPDIASDDLDPSCADGVDLHIPIPHDFRLESGERLPDRHVVARLHGPSPGTVGGRLTVVAGGVSAGRKPLDWWPGVVGPGLAIDPARRPVLAFDFAPLGDHELAISTGDQARLARLALDGLGERRVAFVGASYGAMVGLALAAIAPERVERLLVISGAHRASAQARAWRGIQRRIVALGRAGGQPAAGLALARQLALTTYRTPEDLEARSDLDGWLTARGAAFPKAMGARRWASLAGALDRHAVEPEAVTVPTTVVAVTSDQLVPESDLRRLAQRLPNLTDFYSLTSRFGHDAFLKEAAALTPILNAFLDA